VTDTITGEVIPQFVLPTNTSRVIINNPSPTAVAIRNDSSLRIIITRDEGDIVINELFLNTVLMEIEAELCSLTANHMTVDNSATLTSHWYAIDSILLVTYNISKNFVPTNVTHMPDLQTILTISKSSITTRTNIWAATYGTKTMNYTLAAIILDGTLSLGNNDGAIGVLSTTNVLITGATRKKEGDVHVGSGACSVIMNGVGAFIFGSTGSYCNPDNTGELIYHPHYIALHYISKHTV
jgi:hypothetical protein